MLQVHCEDPVLLDAAIDAALQRGDVLPRYHATTRPSYVEAVATARAMAFGRQSGAPVHVVHLSSAAALREVRRGRADGVRVSAETCPHYLVLTEERYDDPDPVVVRPVRDRAAAPLAGRPRRAVGRAGRRLARPRRHRPRPRPAGRREGRGRQRRPVQPDQQRRARDRDAADPPLLRGRRSRPHHRRAAWSTSWRPPRRAASGSPRKGALEVGRDADLVLFDPAARRTIRRDGPAPHRATTRRTRASTVSGAVRDVFVRGRPVIRDGALRRDARCRPVRRARVAGRLSVAGPRRLAARPGSAQSGIRRPATRYRAERPRTRAADRRRAPSRSTAAPRSSRPAAAPCMHGGQGDGPAQAARRARPASVATLRDDQPAAGEHAERRRHRAGHRAGRGTSASGSSGAEAEPAERHERLADHRRHRRSRPRRRPATAGRCRSVADRLDHDTGRQLERRAARRAPATMPGISSGSSDEAACATSRCSQVDPGGRRVRACQTNGRPRAVEPGDHVADPRVRGVRREPRRVGRVDARDRQSDRRRATTSGATSPSNPGIRRLSSAWYGGQRRP